MDTAERVRENKAPRMAHRQGIRLVKSRTRPEGDQPRLYALIDIQTNGAVNPPIAQSWACSWALGDVEAYLAGDQDSG